MKNTTFRGSQSASSGEKMWSKWMIQNFLIGLCVCEKLCISIHSLPHMNTHTFCKLKFHFFSCLVKWGEYCNVRRKRHIGRTDTLLLYIQTSTVFSGKLKRFCTTDVSSRMRRPFSPRTFWVLVARMMISVLVGVTRTSTPL